jgi:carbon storage regulator
MLVVKRKTGERIVLSNGVEIVLVQSGNGSAKIGVKAPSDVIVDRSEVAERRAKSKAA